MGPRLSPRLPHPGPTSPRLPHPGPTSPRLPHPGPRLSPRQTPPHHTTSPKPRTTSAATQHRPTEHQFGTSHLGDC